MSCFFDTNVLVYVFDKAEPAKQAIAQKLVAEHMGARDMVLSTQVLHWLYVVLTRKKRLGAADALEVVTTLARERMVPAPRRCIPKTCLPARASTTSSS